MRLQPSATPTSEQEGSRTWNAYASTTTVASATHPSPPPLHTNPCGQECGQPLGLVVATFPSHCWLCGKIDPVVGHSVPFVLVCSDSSLFLFAAHSLLPL